MMSFYGKKVPIYILLTLPKVGRIKILCAQLCVLVQ